MGIATACVSALDTGRFFLPAPNALYPLGLGDQGGSQRIRSAVDVPLHTLARLTRPTLRSLTPSACPNTGAESHTKPFGEKQGGLIVPIDLPTKPHTKAPSAMAGLCVV